MIDEAPGIDLRGLRDIAGAGDEAERVPVTRRFLMQVVRELERGRAAEAMANGQQQLDAVLNNIRFERNIGHRVCVDVSA
jgi:hypothetical protein